MKSQPCSLSMGTASVPSIPIRIPQGVSPSADATSARALASSLLGAKRTASGVGSSPFRALGLEQDASSTMEGAAGPARLTAEPHGRWGFPARLLDALNKSAHSLLSFNLVMWVDGGLQAF